MLTLQHIGGLTEGEVRGEDSTEIRGVGSLEGAGPHDLAPLDDAAYVDAARASKAGAIIVSPSLAGELGDRPLLVHPLPLVAMNEVIEALGLAPLRNGAGVHETAVVDPSSTVPASAHVGPYAVLGPGVVLGERATVRAHVVIERGVQVGDDTIIEPSAVLHEGAVIGARCTIGAHAVISRQGFGFTKGPAGPVRLTHVGRTVIGDDSHVGAGCCIDRARYDETSIGAMTGLDNLVHVAHNCRVGSGTFIAAQTGMAGHAEVGNGCEIGGQVGFANKVKVHDGGRVGAQSGLMRDVPRGEAWFGYPAKPMKEAMRMEAALRKLVRRK
ncbi:MAG: UDP-3-O-(3-hydroxymyristoyl)glucosamine N-acyltransferase [Planctomycetota bacterium]